MRTEIVSAANAAGRAVELLGRGEIVALPTETVYGLAADALNPVAVAKIFEAKERPRFDPLIVHLPDQQWLERVARIDHRSRAQIEKLTRQFWPGPLTLVLERQPVIPDMVTAGLNTVAVRMSSHPVFASVIATFGKPLAAPSANRFGRISPTTGRDVLAELAGRIPLIVDAGPTPHGIESTIVALLDEGIEILRRGPVTEEQLRAIGFGQAPRREDIGAAPRAPGQLPVHYAPQTPLRVIESANSFSPGPGERCGLLAWSQVKNVERFAAVRRLSDSQDLREAAANLFRHLRELDDLGLDLIVAERVPESGLGAAIMDRLRRASAK